MAATDTTTETGTEPATDHGHDEHHPTPKSYVQIAVMLAILTGMEIAASYIELGALFLPLLLGLMTIKFIMVAGWFMHLKYDTRLFTRFMALGLILAGTLYTVVLVVFRFQPGTFQ